MIIVEKPVRATRIIANTGIGFMAYACVDIGQFKLSFTNFVSSETSTYMVRLGLSGAP
jgi:hypothetical protein